MADSDSDVSTTSTGKKKMDPLPLLSRAGHAAHCLRCLTALPDSQVEVDPSRYIPATSFRILFIEFLLVLL